MKSLKELCDTFDNLPEKKFLSVMLKYNKNTPEDYQPPCFMHTDATRSNFIKDLPNPNRVNVGSLDPNHVQLALNFQGLECFDEIEMLLEEQREKLKSKSELKGPKMTGIVQFDQKTSSIRCIFHSVEDAAKAMGLSVGSITDAVMNRRVFRGRYILVRENRIFLEAAIERIEREEEMLLEERREEPKKRAREQEKRIFEQEEEDDREEQDASLKSNLHSNVTKAMVTLESEEFLPRVSARITRSNHAKYQ